MNEVRMKTKKHSVKFSYFTCKAVFLMIILDGLNGPGTLISIAQVEGANSRQSPQSDRNNGNGESSNRYDKLGDGSHGEDSKRMRDRCGRYSLLRVLQQWENLQRRCRLNLHSSIKDRERSRYMYTTSGNRPPSPSEIDNILIGKRTEDFGSAAALTSENNRHRNYYYEVNGDALESCCPVVFEVIAPIYGRNRSGHMVELYKDENVQQKFYEYRCHKDYLEQPCRYIDNQHRKISKCVQQYLDTYALVRSDTSLTGWSMEHIRIASGCACKVDRVKASRRRKKVFSSLNPQRSSNNNLYPNGVSTGGKRRRNFHQHTSTLIDY